ncbi:proprotein convertase subtilisin/kexin type 4 isoform X4 [Oryctolagus cuniculus]|uniref:proprotein convertase subtilisin/kexin type 4 isoform X4 n=1 Tax=Oryctolagus cuniculus TaxID=9986 RepID=UPI00387A7D70
MRPAPTALWLRLALALGLALVGPLAGGRASARAPIYVSSWAVRVSQGYREAERLARKFGFVNLGEIFPDGQYFHLRHRGVVQQSLTPHWGHHLRLKREPKVQWFEQQTLRRRVKRSLAVPSDPWFPQQWYMNNEMQADLNVLRVWNQGLTGQGVVVSVLDDGIEKDHPDLWANYDPLASYDFNDYDPDPQPRYTPSDENRHGTRCAGEVAAVANNGFCGTGVAFNARIGGVRMLDGTITDVVEAQSLSLQPQHIHVYSASWGPEDDGRTVDGPGVLTREAFWRGVTQGRGGLGALFVWASGNGGLHYDNCDCDGYTNSIYTLSVGSATQQGRVPWYSEACASTLTTTYSSGVATDPQIPVPDLEGHAAPGGPRVQAGPAAGRGLEDQRRGAPSEPPLRLRAAGRRATGGLGPHLAAHAAPEEVRHPHRAQPHPHPAAAARDQKRVGLRGAWQLDPLAGARAGAAVADLQPPRGPADLAHQPHGHALHARGHQALRHQRPRLQQLDLHVHALLGRGPAGRVDPEPGEQGLLLQHWDAVPLHAAAVRDGRGHDRAAPGPPGHPAGGELHAERTPGPPLPARPAGASSAGARAPPARGTAPGAPPAQPPEPRPGGGRWPRPGPSPCSLGTRRRPARGTPRRQAQPGPSGTSRLAQETDVSLLQILEWGGGWGVGGWGRSRITTSIPSLPRGKAGGRMTSRGPALGLQIKADQQHQGCGFPRAAGGSQ